MSSGSSLQSPVNFTACPVSVGTRSNPVPGSQLITLPLRSTWTWSRLLSCGAVKSAISVGIPITCDNLASGLEASSLHTLPTTPPNEMAMVVYLRPGTWPPQKLWHSRRQSEAQAGASGASRHCALHADCVCGESHCASQLGFLHRPGSGVPAFKLTMAPTCTSLGEPSLFFK